MIGLFKGLTQEIQNKPWIPFGKKSVETASVVSGQGELKEKKKSFCDPDSKKPCITVCTAKGKCECGSDAVRKALKEEIANRQLNFTIGEAKAGCGGKCKNGPLLGFPQKGFFYVNVRPENISQIVEETLVQGRILFPHISINPERSYRSDLLFEKSTGLLAGIDSTVCMVEAAKYFLDFEEGLSCGKCVPCRIGMKRMLEGVDRIVAGEGTEQDLEQIRALCKAMKDTPHCEFALTSSRPVLSAITYFEDEFKAHIERKECPAGVCENLVELQRKKRVRERLKKAK